MKDFRRWLKSQGKNYVRNICEKLRSLEIADQDVEEFARLVDAE